MGVVDRGEKIQFLNQIHVLSVPTVYRESKGLFVLESLANGVPVVLPNHGSFPELIETTSGGILVEPLSTEAINKGLTEIMQNPELRKTLGQKGKESVHQKYTIHQTGVRTLAVLNRYLS